MRISELMNSINKRDLVLPEFQREYIWTKEQAKQLMVSLVKGYPVGGLLFWKTDNPPELKNIKELPEKFGTTQVILDGQQRLTTLHILLTGNVPRYYTQADIQTDPRDLYYNIDTKDFQYYQPSRMKESPLWLSVIDCFCSNEINIFEIAKQVATTDQEAFELAQTYNNNLNNLRGITDVDLPVQTVPFYASLSDAIDIFDRVNSQGSKLTDAELALTHITGNWAQARRVMKEKIDTLANQQFEFDLTFMTRALTGIVTKRALYHTIHDRQRAELEDGWNVLKKILDYLVSLLPGQASIHSTADLSTTNALVPIIVYLSLHDGKFPDEKALKRGLRWLYAAQTWSRYTSQTDQRLEHDVSLIVREERPWEALCNQIIDQRGRIEVKSNDLVGRGVLHPLYRTTLITAKAHGAIDWFNGVPLGTTHGKRYSIHSHHIFPQSVLYGNGYDPENHLHRMIINGIANRAFLTAETNASISNALPEKYLPEVESRYPGALTKQFIPIDPALWKVERFPDFLEARQELIAIKINDFMSAMIAEPEILHERPIEDLIAMGESATLEFKSTLQWDILQNNVSKELRHSVLRTIAAFLNSHGGTLIIGIEDNGNIYGLEKDLKTMDGSIDRFCQLLTSLISEYIGPEYSAFFKIRFETMNGKSICVVEIDKAPVPAFLNSPQGNKEFHVRVGNTTRVLDTEESMNYIQMNWEQ